MLSDISHTGHGSPPPSGIFPARSLSACHLITNLKCICYGSFMSRFMRFKWLRAPSSQTHCRWMSMMWLCGRSEVWGKMTWPGLSWWTKYWKHSRTVWLSHQGWLWGLVLLGEGTGSIRIGNADSNYLRVCFLDYTWKGKECKDFMSPGRVLYLQLQRIQNVLSLTLCTEMVFVLRTKLALCKGTCCNCGSYRYQLKWIWECHLLEG